MGIKKCDKLNDCNLIHYHRTVIHSLNKKILKLQNDILSLKGELKQYKNVNISEPHPIKEISKPTNKTERFNQYM